MIRNHFLQRLSEKLGSRSFFSPEDFEIANEGGQGRDTLSKLTIRYRFDERFRFVAVVHSAKGDPDNYSSRIPVNKIQCTFSPGGITSQDMAWVTGDNELLSLIEEWLTLCHQDLSSTPIVRELATQREAIETLLEQAREVPDIYFSKEEAADLVNKLNDLEEQLKSAIAAREDDRAVMQQEVDALHQEFETLRSQVSVLTKRGWVGSAMVRVAKWAADPENGKLLKGGVDVVKGLLPPPTS